MFHCVRATITRKDWHGRKSINLASSVASKQTKKTLTVNILGFFHHFPPFMQDAVFPFTSKAGHFDRN